MKKKLVVFSGAGISAESGVKTFRDSNGLWENYRVEDVASPEGFERNPQMVLDFYNARRKQLNEVEPNKAHLILAELEALFEVAIVTQNVDDLHERAGSTNVLHLHGELKKARPVNSIKNSIPWEKDLNVGDLNFEGIQLRPDIVWFGEMVSEMDQAIAITSEADLFLVIGTSMLVYPAAGLIHYIPERCKVYVIDPNLPNNYTDTQNHFKKSATEGMELFRNIILDHNNN